MEKKPANAGLARSQGNHDIAGYRILLGYAQIKGLCSEANFVCEEPLLAPDTPGITGERAIRTDDAVAWYE